MTIYKCRGKERDEFTYHVSLLDFEILKLDTKSMALICTCMYNCGVPSSHLHKFDTCMHVVRYREKSLNFAFVAYLVDFILIPEGP